MGLRPDQNPLAGAFSAQGSRLTRDDRSGHGWATVSILAGLLWLFGLGAIIALATGLLARTDARRSGASLVPSTIGLVLGALGVLGGFAFFGWLVFDASTAEATVGATGVGT
ncbi:MAG: hypothetical protein RIE08_16570 [Acidimicrobiales bacterium]